MDITSFNIPDLVRYTDNLDFAAPDWQAKLNTYYTDINTYFMLACNRFKWESSDVKPENRAGKLIEYYLAIKGQCFITKDTKEVLAGVTSKTIDKYGNPTGFTVYGYNGEGQRTVNYDQVIWIKNNPLRIPTLYWIVKYCKRINEVEKTMDLNLQAQKTPYIIECDPLTQTSVKLIFEQINDYKKKILTDKEKSIVDNVKILELNAPYLVNQLQDQKYNEENQLLQLLGIDTINEKNAHMLYAEVQNSNEITDNYTDIFVSERKIAAEAAKEAGINLKLSVLEIAPDMGDLNGEEDVLNVENSNNAKEIT